MRERLRVKHLHVLRVRVLEEGNVCERRIVRVRTVLCCSGVRVRERLRALLNEVVIERLQFGFGHNASSSRLSVRRVRLVNERCATLMVLLWHFLV